ncbi:hypothetical protein [Caulobacter sp. 17J80-11]|uniref:hypothetical protein n=1 Tax=Caulobacter sp. 17J80-11 TaxID=2763502 RepID=UPI001653EC8A|nr:hypothetical protein [Caulobacter sp. 17J80-11]MBC6981386.1 hypothetical protein [Caulobacter sp. 17J80-11]
MDRELFYVEVDRRAHELEASHGRTAWSYAVCMAEKAMEDGKPDEHRCWKAVAAALQPR